MNNLKFLILILGLSLSPAIILAEEDSSQIPSWIKQNARWWADGIITDRDFAGGIGFLVKEKIVNVEVATNAEGNLVINDNLQIPKWLKNNAEWWADGIITDSDFTSGIEFMINDKIITFSENRNAEMDLLLHKAHDILFYEATRIDPSQFLDDPGEGVISSSGYPLDNPELPMISYERAIKALKNGLTAQEFKKLMESVESELGIQDESNLSITELQNLDTERNHILNAMINSIFVKTVHDPNNARPNQPTSPLWDDYESTSTVAEIDEDQLLMLFAGIKWVEYSQATLLDAINQYNKELKTLVKQNEQEYADIKDKALMDAVIEDKNTVKQNEKSAKDLVKLGEQIKKTESEIRKEASKKRILQTDLNKAAEKPINNMEILPPETIDGKLKEATKALDKLDSIVNDIEYAGGINSDKLGKDLAIPEDMKDLPGLGDSADELKVLRKGGTYEGDPCRNEKINAYFHWTLAAKKENTPKVPMYIIFEVWENGKRLNTLMIQNTSDGEFVVVDHDYDPDKTLDEKTFDSIIKKTKGKVKDSFKGHFTIFGDSSEQVITLKIIKVGPAFSGYVYSGNGDPITIKIPACPKKPTSQPESTQAPQEEERKLDIDSVVDDLSIIVDPFTGQRISKSDADAILQGKAKPKSDTKTPTKKPLVQDVYKFGQLLDEIIDNVEKARENIKKPTTSSADAPNQSTEPTKSTTTPSQLLPQAESPKSSPPIQSTSQTKIVKIADRNRSAVQHSADPCLTTHTMYYQFAFTIGGYPQGDMITITESSFRGNLVHQGILDAQGKYQLTIENPPMQPGFEFRLTKYESSSGNKLETTLPDVWQFNVGPCIYMPPSQPPSEQQSGGTGQIYFVQVFAINGKDYPIYQFVSSPPDNCNDYHFHTSGGKAHAIDGTSLNDPAPSGCGFGKTNSMGFTSAGVYKSQIVAWESLTGINMPEDD